MREKTVQIELTTDEIVAISGAILIAKQAAFGYELDEMGLQIVNDKQEELKSVSIKMSNVLRFIKMGRVGI
jgi:hypothetical protein